MTGILLRVTGKQLKEFQKGSSLLKAYTRSEEPEDDDDNRLYLDKSWDAINYLATGFPTLMPDQAQPLCPGSFQRPGTG